MSGSGLVFSADLAPLRDKVIAVIGYGNQGEAQAKALRDSGLNIIVGNARDEFRSKAERDGFKVYDIPEAAARADVIMLLLPDEVQPGVFKDIESAVGSRGVVLDFASGYNIAFGLIRPPSSWDVVMVAPRMIGTGILELHSRGRGYPVLVGVANDSSGRAWDYALAIAQGIGAIGRPGGAAVKVTFKQEALIEFGLHRDYYSLDLITPPPLPTPRLGSMGSQPRRGELHWAPSSASRPPIGFTVAPFT